MRRRKNYLIILILIFIFWLSFALMIFFVEPKIVENIPFKNSYLPFFLNLFLALFFTFAVIFTNSRRGLMAAANLILLLILRLNGLDNLLNLFFIIGLTLVLDRLFSS